MPSSAGAQPARTPHNKDIFGSLTGSFGKYHLWLCFVIFLSKFPIAFHQMAIIFLSPSVSYFCNSTNTSNACPCSKPHYDTSIFTSTIISEWELICDRRWMTSFHQMVFQLGTLMGSIMFGIASDRHGRKKPFLMAIVLQVTLGIIAAFVRSYWTFTSLRFLVGLSVGGTMVIGFVIIMEFVGTKYRDVISALYQVPFNLGHVTLPVFAYVFRDFRHFQLSISIPTLILLSYFWLVPETPRWLIAAKRTDEAVVVLEHVAKRNNRPTDNIKTEVEACLAALERSQLTKANLKDLFRTPNLRKNMLIMSFDWLTCSYCFYGVSQYVGQLSGDVYMNVAASAGVTMLGTLASIPLMKITGRKTIVIIFNFTCALCLYILAFIPAGKGAVVFASIGNVSSFIVFVLVYLYCGELFPTVVRNAALGFSSMMARVGSMIAPFVVDSKQIAPWMPPIGFAILPTIAGCLTYILPETKGCELMTTLEEGENFGKKKPSDAVQK